VSRQVCLWCYHHIKESLSGQCPACRRAYDVTALSVVADPDEMARQAAASKARDKLERKNGKGGAGAGKAEASGSAPMGGAGGGSLGGGSGSGGGGGGGGGGGADWSSQQAAQFGKLGTHAAQQPTAGGGAQQQLPREALQNVRVIQRTLVYVVGLSPRIAREEHLRR
jgi:hypothetical protein